MKFSIITPSFRNSRWLKLCVASVADQQGVELEHIVQDSCSDDGTQDWLPHDRRVRAFIEKDGGMYDAVNHGYRRAQGDILAYLNCDEQYLPGALKAIHDFFETYPEIEVALAGAIVTDADGQYLCQRPALMPHPQHIWFRFIALTAAIFIRRRVIHERDMFFDTRWRDLGDVHWVMAMMKNKVPMVVFDRYTSAFALTGDNMNLKPNAIREKNETDAMIPGWVRMLKPVWIAHHRLRRLAAGHFSLKPTSYSIHTGVVAGQCDRAGQRTVSSIPNHAQAGGSGGLPTAVFTVLLARPQPHRTSLGCLQDPPAPKPPHRRQPLPFLSPICANVIVNCYSRLRRGPCWREVPARWLWRSSPAVLPRRWLARGPAPARARAGSCGHCLTNLDQESDLPA